MTSVEIERRLRSLSQYDLIVNHFGLGIERSFEELPFIEFDKTSYPGVEAHLFTIADASSWQPELTENSDVIFRNLNDASTRVEAWSQLLTNTHRIMSALEPYRQGLKHGILPSSNWVNHEFQWYRKTWNVSMHETSTYHDFLWSVDESIRTHIKELNELGFATTQSCSGLPDDHLNREPYLPYVMFDERAYPRVSAHLFTLADMADWLPSYGPHNFDIELKLQTAEQAEHKWDLLIERARELSSLLAEYRLRFKANSYGYTEEASSGWNQI